ncbi:MAG TPA: outer membrane protein assembly factor BamE [Candidatus Thiothrix moscowensis]|uniref:outer membrane protein assembly factor BamE n=1 Tax=unclassified Thiothrix TaxID=2636184 RepID=UPI001A25AAA5|nr:MULTISPECIES: outer membrane protein assembly factor BamE [unclassified Thiothrix]MBJ6609318.1 outer membrane protein assembly factor BamE [Candidatus Thiothrix moscowensis]HRJ51715.1 outer membrane protein assembly factor BamE [Candidatus Thiothrix moscowensis]HRJ92030.1 outer membrane protein assembly factor BamE [Candidatus Thiothrix moscowensis]
MIKYIISFSLATALLVGGCSSYKMEIQQGNYITSEELAQVQTGMSAAQVQAVLGTPLLVDDFHKNRWDYVFYLKSPGEAVKRSSVTVFFQNGVVRDIRRDDALVEVKPK